MPVIRNPDKTKKRLTPTHPDIVSATNTLGTPESPVTPYLKPKA
jgi:hypothetical protein